MSEVKETKPMVQSSVLWGLMGIAVPFIAEACKYIGALPIGTVPTPVTYAIAGIGWATAVYGRLYGTNLPINGVFISDKK